MPNPIVAVVGGASVIGGAIYSSSQSRKASDAQIDAVRDATALSVAEQRRQFDISMQAIAPWRASGVSALNRLNTILGLTAPSANTEGAGTVNQLPSATTMPTQNFSGSLTGPAKQWPRQEQPAPEYDKEQFSTLQSQKRRIEDEIRQLNYTTSLIDEPNEHGGERATRDNSARSARLRGQLNQVNSQISNLVNQKVGLTDPPQPTQPQPTQPQPTQPQPTQEEMLNALRDLPGYKFSQQENESAIARAMSSRGMTRSGAYDKEILRRSQGLADQNFINYLNPYFNMAGMGQMSAGQMASGSQQFGNNLSSLYMNQGAVTGNARSSNYANQANIWGNALNNVSGGAMYYGYGR